jgi:hypothetical protein
MFGERVRTFCAMLVISMLATTTLSQERAVEIPTDCGALQITGTFSDMRFDEQSQKLVGTEIRIVVTEDGYQASLQFANGRLSDLVIGDVQFNVDLKYWPLGVPLPETEPDADSVEISIHDGRYAGIFKGKVTKTHIEGVLRFVSGDSLTVRVRRHEGYWD